MVGWVGKVSLSLFALHLAFFDCAKMDQKGVAVNLILHWHLVTSTFYLFVQMSLS